MECARYPIIKDGTWWEWNPKQGKYCDTGISAAGDKGCSDSEMYMGPIK